MKENNLTKKEKEIKLKTFLKETVEIFDRLEIETKAKETGFVKRQSKLTGHLFMSIFVFGVTIFGTPTLEDLTSLLNSVLVGMTISVQGLHKRIIKEEASTFFEQLLSLPIELTIPNKVEIEFLENFAHVIILDSTAFQLPQTLAEIFRGHGGSTSKSVVKIQFGYDLKSNQFFYEIQDGISSDTSYKNNFINQMVENDLIIKDLGYFNIQAFSDLEKKHVFFLSRVKKNTIVYVKNTYGEFIKLDLINLAQMTEDIFEIQIYMINRKKQSFKARLVIEKVPEHVKNKRLRKLNKEAQSRGYQLTKRSKFLSGYNLFISNVDSSILPNKHFRTLYGIRWQIEIIFKAWKSHFKLDKITCKNPNFVKCLIFAKLIFIFLSHKIVKLAKIFLWNKHKKELSDYRAFKQIKNIALNLFQTVVKQSKKSYVDILLNKINFIMKYCYKRNQKDRIFPLQLLEIIST